jgi:hypothetical protein
VFLVDFLTSLQHADFRFAWTVGLVVWMTLLAWLMTEHYFALVQPLPPDLRRFGHEFVQAFGRPLIQDRSQGPPITARLRFVSRAKGLEILIAPTDGRTYPNLSDHKHNVAYDVDRVLRLLGNQHVVNGALQTEGKWIVIPILPKADLKAQV